MLQYVPPGLTFKSSDVLPTHCIYVVCMVLRINQYIPTQH